MRYEAQEQNIMAKEIEATIETGKEKRTFTVYEKKGKGFVPDGQVMHSKSPNSAAKKVGNAILKAKKIDSTHIFIREAGIHDRVREYEVTLKEHLIIEPTGFSRLPEKGFAKDKVFKGDEAAFIKRNEHFAKDPNEPATGKLWSEDAVKERNAEWLIVDDVKVGIKLLPGKHVVIEGKSGNAKYIAVHKIPEGTAMSARVPTEPKPAKTEEKAAV